VSVVWLTESELKIELVRSAKPNVLLLNWAVSPKKYSLP
jgi:hypothetical protein